VSLLLKKGKIREIAAGISSIVFEYRRFAASNLQINCQSKPLAVCLEYVSIWQVRVGQTTL
jgi:hypothetical protein